MIRHKYKNTWAPSSYQLHLHAKFQLTNHVEKNSIISLPSHTPNWLA